MTGCAPTGPSTARDVARYSKQERSVPRSELSDDAAGAERLQRVFKVQSDHSVRYFSMLKFQNMHWYPRPVLRCLLR